VKKRKRVCDRMYQKGFGPSPTRYRDFDREAPGTMPFGTTMMIAALEGLLVAPVAGTAGARGWFRVWLRIDTSLQARISKRSTSHRSTAPQHVWAAPSARHQRTTPHPIDGEGKDAGTNQVSREPKDLELGGCGEEWVGGAGKNLLVVGSSQDLNQRACPGPL
jgi:hypothetical protein